MFEGRVALVTGGARGIGRATAELLAQGGARVMLADVDAAAVRAAAKEIGPGVESWAGNLTGDGAAARLIDEVISVWGRIDIIVNNAGYTLDGMAHKLSDADFRAMLEIHTVTPFQILRAAAPHLREPAKADREAGREVFRKVVNVTSMAAYGNPGQANYSAAKAGSIGLTKTLAREWGQLKINVNAVAFGFIDTRLTAVKSAVTVADIDGRSVDIGVPAEMYDSALSLIPLGRPGTVTEAAGAIAFLCSPWSNYVTGQVLNVGGGVPIGMSA